ncbi:hypothetical protein E4J94_17515, partial [Empedobacter tilapiae]
MKNTKNIFYILIAILLMNVKIYAQDIQVLNIPDSNRNPTADNGYTLNGSKMTNALSKLQNPINFGTSGIIGHKLIINNNFGISGSIKSTGDIMSYDIIFIGAFSSNSSFSVSEMDILLEWSSLPGKVLLIMEQASGSPISTHMGYGIANGNLNPTTPLVSDKENFINIFSGAFGNVTSLYQGGGSQGYFSTNCRGISLAKNSNGNSTILFNNKYRDLLFADTDFFTSVGGTISAGSSITNDTDIAWGNVWSWAISEVVNQKVPQINLVEGGEAYTNQIMPIIIGTSAEISLRNNLGNVVGWQTSINGSTWTDVNNTSSIHLSYPNPVNNQQFRAIVGSASCGYVYSIPVTITTVKDCTKPGDFLTAGIPTNSGITTHSKQEVWPGIIPNGFLALESNTKGMVITRVQNSTKITEPKEGMIIYNIDAKCVQLYNGTIWNCIKNTCGSSGETPRKIRLGSYGSWVIGGNAFPAYNSQLTNPVNYGPTGTFKGITGFEFSNITSLLETTTAAQLKVNYDIINGFFEKVSSENAQKIADYVKLGGVAIINIDNPQYDFSAILNSFGITGPYSSYGEINARSSITNQLSNVFGDTKDIALLGSDTQGRVLANQLPSTSTIYAN